MKRHLIAYLDQQPEELLAKMLNWSYHSGRNLDDISPMEKRAHEMVISAMVHLERPEPQVK
jgi:hypothetical protein